MAYDAYKDLPKRRADDKVLHNKAFVIASNPEFFVFFFYLGFLSRPFTNHRTAGEGGGHFFNSSLPLPPASQTLRR